VESLQQLSQQIADARPIEFWPWVAGIAIFAVASFVGVFRCLRRVRLIEDTPTAKIRSAAQGYVELEGWALPGERGMQTSPLGGGSCLWWSYEIARREASSRGNERWRTIEEGTSQTRFVLEDDTGRCIVDPKSASVTTDLSREWYGHSPRPDTMLRITSGMHAGGYRYRERVIMAGEKLYLLGNFITDHQIPGDLPTATDEPSDAVHLLAKPTDRSPFFISTRPQRTLASHYRSSAGSNFAVFVACGAGLTWMLMVRGVLHFPSF
jgi:hypothetical protein